MLIVVADMEGNAMNPVVQLQKFARTEIEGRLPLKTPVTVFGKQGLITGRAFAYERYDILFTDGTIQHSLAREHIEIDWCTARKS